MAGEDGGDIVNYGGLSTSRMAAVLVIGCTVIKLVQTLLQTILKASHAE